MHCFCRDAFLISTNLLQTARAVGTPYVNLKKLPSQNGCFQLTKLVVSTRMLCRKVHCFATSWRISCAVLIRFGAVIVYSYLICFLLGIVFSPDIKLSLASEYRLFISAFRLWHHIIHQLPTICIYMYMYIVLKKPGRVAQSVGHLTRKSGVLVSIPGLATYFRFSFRFFKKGSCKLLVNVCARSTG